jgi:hypothetical protein
VALRISACQVAHVLRSNIERRAKGDLDHAVEDSQKALSIDPNNFSAIRSFEAAKAAKALR